VQQLAAWLWGTPTVVMLFAVGGMMTLQTGFIQVRKLPASFRQIGNSLTGTDRSSFRAVCTALAGTVGTGNVAGVAGAIALGGPGAIFWMWVSGFLGMATKYAEVVLAMRYRKKRSEGSWTGGPMYYICGGLGEHWRPAAILFACSTIMVSFGMGNMVQVNTVAAALKQVLPGVKPYVPWFTGVAVLLLVTPVVFGTAESVNSLLEKLVPLMAALYIFITMAVIVRHGNQLGAVCKSIVAGAFCPESVLGAGAGIGIRQSVQWGISRGVFSNEAGLGSAPMAHASAKASAEEQGLFGIFEVFLDTIVLCTMTAFAILVSGVPVQYGTAAGVELVAAALKTVFGNGAAGLLSLCMTMLALATLIGWQVYGLRCAEYLWGERGMFIYRLCWLGVILPGAVLDLSAVWAFSDVCNGLMCLPNLTALLLLRRQVGQSPCKTG